MTNNVVSPHSVVSFVYSLGIFVRSSNVVRYGGQTPVIDLILSANKSIRLSLGLSAYGFHSFIFIMDPSGSGSLSGQLSICFIFEDKAIFWWNSLAMFGVVRD